MKHNQPKFLVTGSLMRTILNTVFVASALYIVKETMLDFDHNIGIIINQVMSPILHLVVVSIRRLMVPLPFSLCWFPPLYPSWRHNISVLVIFYLTLVRGCTGRDHLEDYVHVVKSTGTPLIPVKNFTSYMWHFSGRSRDDFPLILYRDIISV